MARKKKVEPPENHERWLVSYADFMTLLFAVFVILYGFAMSKQTEVKALVQGLIQSFTEMGFVTARPGSTVLSGNYGVQQGNDSSDVRAASPNQQMAVIQAPTQGGGGLLDTGQPPTNQPMPSQKSDLESKDQLPIDNATNNNAGAPFDAVKKEFKSSLEELISSGLVNIKEDENWLTIELNSGLIFPSGSVTLLNRAKPVLAQIAKTLAPIRNYVRVRGYTDNVQMSNELFSSNWELSAQRALAVLTNLISNGIPPQQLAIESYGEYSPFASNSTIKGREQNRKVVIAVSKFGYVPKNLPVLADDSVSKPNGAKDEPFNPDHYGIIQLPDGRFKLTRQD